MKKADELKQGRKDLAAIAELTNRGMLEIAEVHEKVDDVMAKYTFPEKFTHAHYQKLLFTLVYAHEPKLIIETGMAEGVSTAYILAALESMQVDEEVPAFFTVEAAFSSATMIERMVRWGFIFGELPPITAVPKSRRYIWYAIGDVTSEKYLTNSDSAFVGTDLFLHDSDHGYECQAFEYSWAWDHLAPGGLLVSDDYVWNHEKPDGTIVAGLAWKEFVEREQVPWYTIGNAAVAKKVTDGEDP